MYLEELFVVAIDDEPQITQHLSKQLIKHCKECITFNSSYEASHFIEKNKDTIDIVISDIRMPKMDGIELSKKIKDINKDIIIILLSASNDIEYLMEAIDIGIDKFISKPYRITSLLETLEQYAQNIVNKKAAQQLKTNEEIRKMQESIICMLGNIIENRSKEVNNHVKRVSLYTEIIAKKLNFDEHKINLLKLSSILHDVGKIAISDIILNKPSSLNAEEFETIKTHTTIGYDILKESNTELFKMAANVAYSHHENWDGSGYPCGLKNEEISLEGRIIALCDVFDALAQDRCYKEAWSIDKVIGFIQEQKGKKFDPSLVDIFLDSLDDILHIYRQYDEK